MAGTGGERTMADLQTRSIQYNFEGLNDDGTVADQNVNLNFFNPKFGAFYSLNDNTDFYASYNEEFPLENNWEERINLCNLYPLLVHVNLFGGGYLNQVKNILSYYVG